MRAKTAQEDRIPLGTVARTGEVCPQDGVWSVRHVVRIWPQATRYLRKGEIMPPLDFVIRRFAIVNALFGKRIYRTDET